MRFVLLGLLLLAACAVPEGTRPRVVTASIGMAERYERVALREDDGSPTGTISRWERPLAWYLDADPAVRDTWHASVAAHMAELQALTGLAIAEADPRRANFVVAIRPQTWINKTLDQFDLEKQGLPDLRFATCSGFMSGRNPDVPEFAMMLIPTEGTPAHIQTCILQEITQGLGLRGDIDERDDTIFSSYATRQDMSAIDRELVRLHYSGGIKPGMPAADAMAYVRGVTAGR